MEAENLQRLQPNVLDDSFKNTDDLCSGTSDHTASAARELTKEEMCPNESTLRNLGDPEDSGHEDLTWSQESTVRQLFVHLSDQCVSHRVSKKCFIFMLQLEFSLSETRKPMKEGVRHPVSAMDRERTMRNLVDMQRKFETKHQRDKERQLLRVRYVKTKPLQFLANVS